MEAVFFQLAEQLTPEEIFRVCSINIQFQQLCENEDLWQNLYLRRFGPLSYSPISWKYEYVIRNTPQKVFQIGSMGNLYSLSLPSNFPGIKKLVFSPLGHSDWILTWDGKVYRVLKNSFDGDKRIISSTFKLEDTLFNFPVDQLVTSTSNTLAIDKQGQAYIFEQKIVDASIKPLILPEFNGSPQLVKKVWLIFNSIKAESYYVLSKNDQMYVYKYSELVFVPELSNREIIELGNSTSNIITVITSTQKFARYWVAQSKFEFIDLIEPIIMVDNLILLTANHQAYWIENLTSNPIRLRPWINTSVQKIAGNFALTESEEIYHYTDSKGWIIKNELIANSAISKLGDYRMVDIFRVGLGKNQLMILAALPVPITRTIYQKLVDYNQIDYHQFNQPNLVKDIRGNWLMISDNQ